MHVKPMSVQKCMFLSNQNITKENIRSDEMIARYLSYSRGNNVRHIFKLETS